MTVAAAGASVVLGMVTAAIFGSVASGFRLIGQQADPEVIATTDLYFRLNDMDAQVANVLLVGGQQGLGIDRQQALHIYEQDRRDADLDLQRAAVVTGSVPSAQAALRSVLDELGSYEALAAEATYLDGQAAGRPGRPPEAALLLYRQATDLLKSAILPSARSLTEANAAALDRAYQAKRSSARQGALCVVLLGVVLLAILIGLQLYLTATHRRLLNPWLAAASLAALVLVVVSASTLSAQAEHLRVAKQDAFDSIIALSQARAISYDANADESRYLVDPARSAQYQQSFEAKSQELLSLPGATIFRYDAALGAAASAYHSDHADIRFGGYFGVEFRNITFAGERAAAARTLAAYQLYERDDRQIRALNRSGDLRGAIAFDTSYAPGNSNWAFSRYDHALVALIAINQDAFSEAISTGEHDVAGWTGLIPAGTVIGLLLLLLAGVRPRLAEYR